MSKPPPQLLRLWLKEKETINSWVYIFVHVNDFWNEINSHKLYGFGLYLLNDIRFDIKQFRKARSFLC